ncbi:MAG: polysulfide reductase NrfD, partial [Candidatus Rokubacteria bacterium]|nr:polysulfide reductase NrfD [Candidatus Rokubacteria bacterium]
VYAASKGVPFWNSPVLPILYATYAIRGGLALLLVVLPLTGGPADAHRLEFLELWVAVSAAVMLGFYLGVMRNTNLAARRSVAELTGGRVAVAFYLGTVGVGLLVPIVVGLAGLAGPLSQAALALVGALSLVGDFFAKYAIAKAGIYVPLMPAGRA